MPQLDIYSFTPVINWLIIVIFIFYIISVVKGLGVLNKILNYRRRSLEKKREGKEEQEEEGYYVEKNKGIKGENNVIKGGRVKEVEEVRNERKKEGSMCMSMSLVIIDGVEIENNLPGIVIFVGVVGVGVFLMIKKKKKEKYENIVLAETSGNSTTSNGPKGNKGGAGYPGPQGNNLILIITVIIIIIIVENNN